MISPKKTAVLVAALGAGLMCLPAPEADASARPASVRIGMLASMFRDVPPSLFAALSKPFTRIIESQAGLTGEVVQVPDPDALAGRIMAGELQLGVFHGFEFAWVRQQHPSLKPLVVVVNQSRRVKAHVVVRQDSPCKCVGDLTCDGLCVGKGTKEYCQMFLDRTWRTGHNGEAVPASLKRPETVFTALDEVVAGTSAATVVDSVAFESYSRVKPHDFGQLRVAASSEWLPLSCVAYREGGLSESAAQRLHKTLTNLSASREGRNLLMLWKLTGFEPVPADYNDHLAVSLKAYPPLGE